MADLYTEARKRADETIDEQAILDKYNAATIAQFNAQREQNRINENNFYNQMYNTQRTAMDTIRQSNAAAVASGASRGVQAAQELSSLLGLQQESVASATELAQANRQTAQEETAAVLENVLNAYKEAEAQKQQAVTQEIQAESLKAEQTQANAAEAANLLSFYQQALANGDAAGASAAWSRLQSIFALNNSAETGGATTTNPTPVFESGIQADGRLAFSTSDLNEKNVSNIYHVLDTAGYKTDQQRVIDLTDPEDYNQIRQADFNKDKQAGEAAKYITAITRAANNNELQPGDIVQLNYGDQSNSGNYMYTYLGNNKFAKVDIDARFDISFADAANTKYGHGITSGYDKNTGKDFQTYIQDRYKGRYNFFVPKGYAVDISSVGLFGVPKGLSIKKN